MNLPFAIAGVLAIVGAVIHGLGGEVWVVRRLRTETLSGTQFGGPSTTKLMIHVTWHVATIVFLVIGAGLLICAPAGPSDGCRAIGQLTTISFASFAALALGLAGKQAPRALLRHRGPLIFVIVAALAWWGWASI